MILLYSQTFIQLYRGMPLVDSWLDGQTKFKCILLMIQIKLFLKKAIVPRSEIIQQHIMKAWWKEA